MQPGGGAIALIGLFVISLLFASARNQCSHQYVRVTLVNKMSLNNYCFTNMNILKQTIGYVSELVQIHLFYIRCWGWMSHMGHMLGDASLN